MTHRYMLDTNVLSNLMRNPGGEIAKQIEAVGEDSICISVVVASELRYGAAKKQSDALTLRVDAVLSAIDILPMSPPVDKVYAEIRAQLNAKGTPIGPNDLFIAAHALTEHLTLITANEFEYKRVPSLPVINWEAS